MTANHCEKLLSKEKEQMIQPCDNLNESQDARLMKEVCLKGNVLHNYSHTPFPKRGHRVLENNWSAIRALGMGWEWPQGAEERGDTILL